MGDVVRQVGLEDDVHRAADAHLAAERQPGILRDLGIAAIGADQVLGADLEFVPRQPVAHRRRHAVVVLRVAQVLGGHARLRAARGRRS